MARYFEYKEVLLINKKKPGNQREKWEEDSKKHSKQKSKEIQMAIIHKETW